MYLICLNFFEKIIHKIDLKAKLFYNNLFYVKKYYDVFKLVIQLFFSCVHLFNPVKVYVSGFWVSEAVPAGSRI